MSPDREPDRGDSPDVTSSSRIDPVEALVALGVAFALGAGALYRFLPETTHPGWIMEAERHPDWTLVALDNLHRRGSELNLPRLRGAGVRFVHGDVRSREDVLAVEDVGAVVEASAEPSVLAALDGGLDYLCRRGAQLLFLSTSRVYSVEPLRGLGLTEIATRFELDEQHLVPGASAAGITERFPRQGPRTLYGATKLAAEVLIAEYVEAFGVRAAVDLCRVIAGRGRWATSTRACSRSGWSPTTSSGRSRTSASPAAASRCATCCTWTTSSSCRTNSWATGTVLNVGGGRDSSLSRLELTEICRSITGNTVDVGSEPGFAVVPISWTNRTHGTSKLGLHEMGGRYLFIVLYVFLERHFRRGDYPPLADEAPSSDARG